MVILIADDDRLSRFALKSMLCEHLPQESIIHEVSNGKRLVEQCKLYQPDIAFVDIDMPQLDGLSAISCCKEFSPNTQFVVFSGHSDFNYARKSIELQVTDYLLKPVDAEALKAVLLRIEEMLHDKRRTINMHFNVLVSECFRLWEEIGYYPLEDPFPDLPGRYYAFRFYLDTVPSPERYRSAYLELTATLHNVGRQLALSRIPYMLWEPKEMGLDFIVRSSDTVLDSLRRKLEQTVQTVSGSHLVISCMYVEGIDLWTLFKKLTDMAACEAYRLGIPCQSVSPFSQLHFCAEENELLQQSVRLMEAYQEANESNYNKALASIQRMLQISLKTIDPQKLVQILSVGMSGRFSWDGKLDSLYRQLLRHRDQIYKSTHSTEKDKFSEIVKFIDKHYMEDLSITMLADKMGLTPNYFSKIFHDRMGRTFSQYLTEVRIAQARRILLVRKDVRVKDLSLMVGYFSSRHFTNVFKRMTGCYPSEFRKQHLNEENDPPSKERTP